MIGKDNNNHDDFITQTGRLELVDPVRARLAREEKETQSKFFLVGLLAGSTLLLCLILFLFWALPYFGKNFIPPAASNFLLAVVSVLGGLAVIFCAVLAAGLWLGIKIPGLQHFRWVMNWVLFPLMRGVGILLRMPKSKIRLAFIRINNELTRSSGTVCNPGELLVLLPHCIQKSSCVHRLTHNIQNCTRCGACTVGPLLNLGDKYGVEIVIVPGGTVARQMVKERMPKCIIAVACHRDLVSGVRDVAALPVYGIVNQRPHGPCINTSVDVVQVEDALQAFLGK